MAWVHYHSSRRPLSRSQSAAELCMISAAAFCIRITAIRPRWQLCIWQLCMVSSCRLRPRLTHSPMASPRKQRNNQISNNKQQQSSGGRPPPPSPRQRHSNRPPRRDGNESFGHIRLRPERRVRCGLRRVLAGRDHGGYGHGAPRSARYHRRR
eukprot:COSAG06_NODE_7915_length_2333_cov_1.473614_3_plen_153_part_00